MLEKFFDSACFGPLKVIFWWNDSGPFKSSLQREYMVIERGYMEIKRVPRIVINGRQR